MLCRGRVSICQLGIYTYRAWLLAYINGIGHRGDLHTKLVPNHKIVIGNQIKCIGVLNHMKIELLLHGTQIEESKKECPKLIS